MIEDDVAEYAKVPPDFPLPISLSSISGAHPKLLGSEYKGNLYPPGCTPPEIYERWKEREEIAEMLAYKANRSRVDKMTLKSETEILLEYSEILSKMSWLSKDEVRWVIQRVGHLLSWPVPS